MRKFFQGISNELKAEITFSKEELNLLIENLLGLTLLLFLFMLWAAPGIILNKVVIHYFESEFLGYLAGLAYVVATPLVFILFKKD